MRKNERYNSYENIAYPLSIFECVIKDEKERNIINLLKSINFMACDILPDNTYEMTKSEDDGKNYIKIKTCSPDLFIIMIIPKDERIDENTEDVINKQKADVQDIKKIDLLIKKKNSNYIYEPSILFGKTHEVYITPNDLEILSKFDVEDIKNQIISVTTDKFINNRTRKTK